MYSLRLPDRVPPVAATAQGEGLSSATATAMSTQPTTDECATDGYDEAESAAMPATAATTAVVVSSSSSSNEDGTHDRSSSLSPTLLLKLFQAHKPQFSGADQQDAQEFLTELLDTLHEDLKGRGRGKPSSSSSMDPPHSSSATTTTIPGRYLCMYVM